MAATVAIRVIKLVSLEVFANSPIGGGGVAAAGKQFLMSNAVEIYANDIPEEGRRRAG